MTRRMGTSAPPGGVIPVVVPGDVVLVREPGLAVWAGAVTVFPKGFQFTLLALFDTDRGLPPVDFALLTHERDHLTWLEITYADGRARAADLNANTPSSQPEGPHLDAHGVQVSWSGGWARSDWWVTPLPPAGPVELAIHIGGSETPTGTGRLDGRLIADAASGAEVLWPNGLTNQP
jgi:hypothetical protein